MNEPAALFTDETSDHGARSPHGSCPDWARGEGGLRGEDGLFGLGPDAVDRLITQLENGSKDIGSLAQLDELAKVPPERLTHGQCMGLVKLFEQVATAYHARAADLTAYLLKTADGDLAAERAVTSLIALAAGCTEGEVRSLAQVGQGRQASEALKQSLDLGKTTFAGAKAMTSETKFLDPDSAASVYEKVLEDQSANNSAKQRLATRHEVARSQADTAGERHAKARSERRVVLEHSANGMSWVKGYLPSFAATSIKQRLRRQAESRALGGLTLNQAEADLFTDYLLSNPHLLDRPVNQDAPSGGQASEPAPTSQDTTAKPAGRAGQTRAGGQSKASVSGPGTPSQPATANHSDQANQPVVAKRSNQAGQPKAAEQSKASVGGPGTPSQPATANHSDQANQPDAPSVTKGALDFTTSQGQVASAGVSNEDGAAPRGAAARLARSLVMIDPAALRSAINWSGSAQPPGYLTSLVINTARVLVKADLIPPEPNSVGEPSTQQAVGGPLRYSRIDSVYRDRRGPPGGEPPGLLGGEPPGLLGGEPPGLLGGEPPGLLGGEPPGLLGGEPPGLLAQTQATVVGSLSELTDNDLHWIVRLAHRQAMVVHPNSGRLVTLGQRPVAPGRPLATPTQTWDWHDPTTWPAESASSGAYQPSDWLTLLVMVRDQTCRWPGCIVPSTKCQIDHHQPFSFVVAPESQTQASNLGCLCLLHHRVKHQDGWTTKRDPVSGITTWTHGSGLIRQVSPLTLE